MSAQVSRQLRRGVAGDAESLGPRGLRLQGLERRVPDAGASLHVSRAAELEGDGEVRQAAAAAPRLGLGGLFLLLFLLGLVALLGLLGLRAVLRLVVLARAAAVVGRV